MKFAIDLLRHLFCVAVIVQHGASATRYSEATAAALARTAHWVEGAVLGFFFISGFLFKGGQGPGQAIAGGARRLLLPFLVFSAAYAGLLALAGKSTIEDGLLSTVTLRGSGMQLYFLPFLFYVATFVHLVESTAGRRWAPVAHALLAISVFGACLLPTDSPTGPDLRLLPLYLAAYTAGILHRRHFGADRPSLQAVWTPAALLVLGLLDPRFVSLAQVSAVFVLVSRISAAFPDRRIAGSGGIYLLHTPIVNFAISTLLQRAGVTQMANVASTVALTYVSCLGATLAFKRAAPGWSWLLLE